MVFLSQLFISIHSPLAHMVSEKSGVILCSSVGQMFFFSLTSIRIFFFSFDFLYFENDMSRYSFVVVIWPLLYLVFSKIPGSVWFDI